MVLDLGFLKTKSLMLKDMLFITRVSIGPFSIRIFACYSGTFDRDSCTGKMKARCDFWFCQGLSRKQALIGKVCT